MHDPCFSGPYHNYYRVRTSERYTHCSSSRRHVTSSLLFMDPGTVFWILVSVADVHTAVRRHERRTDTDRQTNPRSMKNK